MTQPVRVGVIGAGRIGRIHASNLSYRIEGAELRAVADVDPEAATGCAKQCKIDTVYTDPRRLIEHPEIDAVVICSSTHKHAEQIIQAAEAGKHIFCEKPIDYSLERIDAALAAVARARVKLQIGFNRRFDPGFRRAQEMVASGKIGVPHLVRITSRDPSPPPVEYIKVSGGLFFDMSIHDFDMSRWIIGSEVEEVYAMAASLVDPAIGAAGDVDTALVSLRYAGGALGAIDNSRRAVYGYDQRVEVFGSAGGIIVSNVPTTTAVLSREEGVIGELPLHFFLERYDQAYVAELLEFVTCVQKDRTPSVGGIDGRIPVMMAQAARRSYEEHRPVRVA